MSAAPSAAFLGDGAHRLAKRALRSSVGQKGDPPLMIVWGGPPAGGRSAVRGALAAAVEALPEALPMGWVVTAERRMLVVTVPDGDPATAAVLARRSEGGAGAPLGGDGGALAADAAAVLRLLVDHGGPVGVVIAVPRSDVVDDVLRAVDEVVVAEPSSSALTSIVREELVVLNANTVFVAPPRSGLRLLGLGGPEDGQSTVVVIGIIALVLAVAGALGIVASALGRSADVQGRVDVAALAGAKALQDGQARLFDPDPAQRISETEQRRRAIDVARRAAEANDLRLVDAVYVDDDGHPLATDQMATRMRVRARSLKATGHGDRILAATAEVAVAALPTGGSDQGDYTGPLAVRQGQRMRPDVAIAFDRMAAAASGAGIGLVIVSGYRSDAEQAELFRRHPDPKWVAPPGRSLHRLGTELDLGPASAYGWLAANCGRFGFLKRYAWEAWHFGFTRSAGSASVGYRAPSVSRARRAGGGGERASSAVPSFVPARYASLLIDAAQRWNVGAALLGAQLAQESGFNPRAVSGAGAAGIAQFMPGAAASYGLTPAERFEPAKAIMAQAHLMHDLLRQFGSVPLALAAYNAGPGNVSPCMCVPGIPETQAYVQAILARLGGAGLAAAAGLQIRLVA